MTTTDLRGMTVAMLWDALRVAQQTDDHDAVRAIEQRMRDLQGPARFAALSDAELDARIAALDANRAPTGLLAYSPGGNDGMDAGIADLPRMNRAIIAQQHVGLEAQRSALLDERARRGGPAHGDADGPPPPADRSLWRRLLGAVGG